MAGRRDWPGYAEQAAAEQALAAGGMWGLPSNPQDVSQRGRQMHRDPPAPLPACGSWQQGGGPGASGGGQTRSLSASPADLAERWAAGQAAHTHLEARPQPGGWQPAPRLEPSTHFASHVLPLLAEAPAQPSPSALLPVEQQQWLKRRLEQAQQQLARQRHEQAEWAAAAAQLLRGRAPQPPAALQSAPADEPWCPTCRASGQDSTEAATESQQLEDLIDGLEIEMEQQLEELQRRQRWAAQHPQAHQLPAHQLPAHHPHPNQLPPQLDRAVRERQRQAQEPQALLHLDQEQWQRAAAAAMQRQPPGGQLAVQPPAGQPFAMAPPFGSSGHSMAPPFGSGGHSMAPPFGSNGHSMPDECPPPVRLSAPARMEQHPPVSFGMAGGDPGLLLNRAWQQQQQHHQQHQHQQHHQQHHQQQHHQQQQHSWQQQQQQQQAPQRFEPAGQPWEELTRTGAQLQVEQQQWAAHARQLLARSSAGPSHSWR